MEEDQLAEALQIFETYDGLQTRIQNVSKTVRHLLEAPIEACVQQLDKACSEPDIRQVLGRQLSLYAASQEAIDYLRDSQLPGTDDEKMRQAKEILAEQARSPLYRLAKYAGEKALLGETNLSESAETFLSEPADVVADKLVGKVIRIDGRQVTIIKTRPQGPEFNKQFLTTRPIFGPNRQDVYVGASRGRYLLFLRAGDATAADSCVTIMSVRDDETVYETPSKVTQALGINTEKVGSAHFENGAMVLNLTDRKKLPKNKTT